MRILILQDDIQRINIFKHKLNNQIVDISDDANAVIQYLKLNTYDYLFLDHDLGGLQNQWNEQNCGMVVVNYLINLNPILNNMICIVHSYNYPRGMQMNDKLTQAGYTSTYSPGAWNLLVVN